MSKLMIAAALIAALATPALAQSKKAFVVYDKSTKTCSVTLTAPTETEKFSMMGTYGSSYEAEQAMAGMKECKR